MACAVSATTTTPAMRASERILRVTASPSSPGSWMSMSTISGSSRVISARHSAPLPALRTENPFFSRRNWARRKLTGLSSTIKTLPAVTACPPSPLNDVQLLDGVQYGIWLGEARWYNGAPSRRWHPGCNFAQGQQDRLAGQSAQSQHPFRLGRGQDHHV